MQSGSHYPDDALLTAFDAEYEVLPDSLDDSAISSRFTREDSDQAQVHSLKERAYPALAKEVARPVE